ncbi:MAG: Patatin [Parcubacteria group bacterium GW2011_GWA1_Parcubacteria_45_10]|nr:MAG: Patatin [Parcubacteria group bacterium GW2011_GWA1_Parcubacteria_45_10]
MESKKFPKIGLALSGGGAKGLAHISVIKELEKLGLPIFCVAGTSIGALVGAWYAAGKDFDVLLGLAKGGKWRKFLHVGEIYKSVRKDGGLFSLSAFSKFLDAELGKLKIEDLEKKFCAIATSLTTGKKVEIKSGSLGEAVMASGCLPVIFSPVKKGNDLLVDGGVVSNFPVDECFKMGADFVIGVDVRYAPGYIHEEIKDDSKSSQWKIFKVLFYLMEMVNTQESIQESDKLLIVKPYISHVSTFDFEKAEQILALGQEAFTQKEDELRKKLKLPEKEKTFWEMLFE